MLKLRDKRYNDIRLTFKEEGHKYYDSNGNTYLSATTLLHQLEKPFDKKYWLRKKAKELHTTPEKLAKQWQDITDEACKRGTATHNGLEDGIRGSSMFKEAIKYMIKPNGEMITVADIPNINVKVKTLDLKEFIDYTDNKYPDVYKVFRYYIERDYKIYSEIGAFLPDYLLSGTIDVLIVRDDKFIVGDWKTNRGGLKFESGYYKKDKTKVPNQLTDEWITTHDTLLPPCAHLPACNGSIYNLQVSLYAFMVELILGIPNAGLWLCHIDSDFVLNEYGQPKRFPDGLYHVKKDPHEKTTLYKLKYLKQDIINILNDRLRKIVAEKNNKSDLFG